MKEINVMPAAPGWFLVGVNPLIGASAWGDVGSLESPPAYDFEYQVFAPGENPLPQNSVLGRVQLDAVAVAGVRHGRRNIMERGDHPA